MSRRHERGPGGRGNFLFDEDGGDEDEDDYDEEYEAGLYEITCPQCGEVVCVDEDMLANDDLACPNCGTKFEVDFSEDERRGRDGRDGNS